MKEDRIYKKLLDYCRWNYDKEVRELLAVNAGLDVLGGGAYLGLAIKHSNVAMLNTLLQYYKETKLQGDPENMEYKAAKQELSNILEEAEERSDISPEIRRIISPYMSFTDEGLVLLDVKKNLSDAGFTLPHFHQHLDNDGFNNADEDDMCAVLDELKTLQSRLHYMYSGNEYDENKELIEQQIHEIEVVLDPSAELEDFGEFPDHWEEPDEMSAAAEDHSADYVEREVMGDNGNGNLAEGFSSSHSPPIIGC